MIRAINLFLVILMVCLYSCKEEEHYDIQGDASNKVYITCDGDRNFTIVHTPVVSVGNVKMDFQLCCTQKANGVINASLCVDNKLVEEYNKAHGTSYVVVPENLLSIENQTIQNNMQRGEKSVTITVPSDKLSELSERSYLLPVKVSNVEGNATPATSVVYAIITTSVDNDNYWEGATPKDVNGVELTNKAEWDITFTNTNIDYHVTDKTYRKFGAEAMALIIDGDDASYAVRMETTYDGTTTDFIVNLGNKYNLVGFYMRAKGYMDAIKGIVLSVSADGETWNEITTIKEDKGELGNIMFYSPVEARYVKAHFPGDGGKYPNATVYMYEFKPYIVAE